MYNQFMKMILPRWKWILTGLFLLAGLPLLNPALPISAQSENPRVLMLSYDGPLTPVLVDYLKRGISEADRGSYSAIILQLNTPGGSIDLMNKTVTEMRASPLPIVVYVSPRGAMAGSAGTVITLAGHVSAMSPETTIGAASPVNSGGADIGATMEAKVKEMLKATVRGLAAHRGEDAIRLAEDTIENARAVSADEALAAGLVDIIARDPIDLLHQLDGREVLLESGSQKLAVSNAEVVPFAHSFIEDFLTLLINPNLVFLLLALGVQAILIEIASPGGWFAGFFGVICVAMAVYGMGILPVNLFGLVFVVVAFVLFILEFNTPTHGVLTLAGTGSFIVGALVLFNGLQESGFGTLSIPLVIGTGVFLGGLIFTIITIGLRAQFKPAIMGTAALIGKTGVVITPLTPQGEIQVAGERWTAILKPGSENIQPGCRVIVTGIEGLRLLVKPSPKEAD